jgi:hypothetical protein
VTLVCVPTELDSLSTIVWLCLLAFVFAAYAHVKAKMTAWWEIYAHVRCVSTLCHYSPDKRKLKVLRSIATILYLYKRKSLKSSHPYTTKVEDEWVSEAVTSGEQKKIRDVQTLLSRILSLNIEEELACYLLTISYAVH